MNSLKKILEALHMASQQDSMEHMKEDLETALAGIAENLEKEKEVADGESQEEHSMHLHTSQKLKHAKEHLERALKEAKDNMPHALRDLGHARAAVKRALADGLRACAAGEGEHAITGLLGGLVAVSSSKTKEAVPLIQQAVEILQHAQNDLADKAVEGSKIEKMTHAVEDIEHAIKDLKNVAGELQNKDTNRNYMMKHLMHAVKDLQGAKG